MYPPGARMDSGMQEAEVIEWTDDDVTPVAAVVAELQRAGAGWVNLDPAVAPADLPPPRGGLSALLSSRGPDVPRVTWVVAKPPGSASVGIHHGAGSRARSVLAQFGLDVPPSVRVVQDHARRGLVAEVAGDQHTPVLEWLVAAATALSTVPLTGRWR